jgi:hypothetical protein
MAMRWTQHQTEMSTRNLPGGKGRPERKADNLTAICESTVCKMWKPRRLTMPWVCVACYRNNFTYYLTFPKLFTLVCISFYILLFFLLYFPFPSFVLLFLCRLEKLNPGHLGQRKNSQNCDTYDLIPNFRIVYPKGQQIFYRNELDQTFIRDCTLALILTVNTRFRFVRLYKVSFHLILF